MRPAHRNRFRIGCHHRPFGLALSPACAASTSGTPGKISTALAEELGVWVIIVRV